MEALKNRPENRVAAAQKLERDMQETTDQLIKEGSVDNLEAFRRVLIGIADDEMAAVRATKRAVIRINYMVKDLSDAIRTIEGDFWNV